MSYIKSNDGINADGGLRSKLPPELEHATKAERIAAGWYDYVPTAPEIGENQVCVCTGFVRLGEDFTGVYEVRDVLLPDTRYYAVDILSAIGDVVGAERYDGIKAALASTRIGGVPVWDMLISGMFIPADDPRLQMIRNALVESELLTDAEFDRILALAASDEPVPESGAAEG